MLAISHFMNNSSQIPQKEIEELKHEIESFQREKERVRSIVGQIGGVPTSTNKIYNAIFVGLVIVCLITSIFFGGTIRLVAIEAAVALLSLKIIYLMHSQSRVNHFQLWILTSLEWRINEMVEKVHNLEKR